MQIMYTKPNLPYFANCINHQPISPVSKSSLFLLYICLIVLIAFSLYLLPKNELDNSIINFYYIKWENLTN